MGISSALGTQALLPAGLGFRNKIINGDFRINQRGFTSSANPANVYGFDRWNMYSNNGTSTYSPQSFSLGNAINGYEPTQYLRIVSTGQSATNAATIVAQKIEDVRTCAGQTTSISFWAKCGTAGKKVAVELSQNFGTGGSPSSSVFTLVSQVTLSTTWTRYTLNVVTPSISGKTLGTNNNHFLELGFWFSAGTGFNARTGSLGIQSDTFEIWGVQLENNYQPTTFEQRPIGVELALCQRYYWRIKNITTSFLIGSASFGRTNVAEGFIEFPTTMRVQPTALEISSHLHYYWRKFDGTVNNLGLISFGQASFNTARILIYTSAAGNNQLGYLTGQDLSGFMGFSAEL